MDMASSWTKPEGIAVVLGTKGAFAVGPYGRGRPCTDRAWPMKIMLPRWKSGVAGDNGWGRRSRRLWSSPLSCLTVVSRPSDGNSHPMMKLLYWLLQSFCELTSEELAVVAA
jgi:hypothetical protein